MLWNTEQYIIEYEKEYRQIPTNKKSRTFTMKTQLSRLIGRVPKSQ